MWVLVYDVLSCIKLLVIVLYNLTAYITLFLEILEIYIQHTAILYGLLLEREREREIYREFCNAAILLCNDFNS